MPQTVADLIATTEPDRRVWVVLVLNPRTGEHTTIILDTAYPPVSIVAWTGWKKPDVFPVNLNDEARSALMSHAPAPTIDVFTSTPIAIVQYTGMTE